MDRRTDTRAALAAFAVMGTFWGAFAALVPDLKAAAGASDRAFGWAMLIAAVGAVLAMWLAPLAERAAGRGAMALAAAATAAGFLLPGLAGSVLTLGLALALASAASGVLDVVMNARVSQLEADRGRPLMSLAHALFSYGYAAAAFVTGLVRGGGGGAMTVYGGLALVTLVLLPMLVAAPAPRIADASVAPPPRWSAATRRVILLCGMVVLFGFMAEQAADNWAALHLERTLGAAAVLGSFGPAMLGVTMGTGRLAGQALALRFGERATLTAGAIAGACGATLAAAAPSLPLAYAGFAALGLGVSVLAPVAFAVAGQSVTDAIRSTAIARVAVIGYGGFFVGPPLMGFLSEGFGLRAAFVALAGMLLVVAVVVVPLLFRRATSRDGA